MRKVKVDCIPLVLATILFRTFSSSRLISENAQIKIYKTIILPVVLYGRETWSLALREEHRLRVFENMVLRRIFGLKRDEIIAGWRKLHNEELLNSYFSPNIIRIIKSMRMRLAGHVARTGEKTNAYKMLVENPEEKRPLGRPRRRWEDDIKRYLRGIGWGGMDRINLAQNRDQ
jgi:hypothetical protein